METNICPHCNTNMNNYKCEYKCNNCDTNYCLSCKEPFYFINNIHYKGHYNKCYTKAKL